MTTKTIDYSSRDEYLTDAKLQNRNGFRSIHYDFPHKITYTNDPEPAPPPKRQLTERQLLDEVAQDRNVTIT